MTERSRRDAREECDVNIRCGLSIRMRDGIHLSVTLYSPGNSRHSSIPCIVIMTPYGADHVHDRAAHYARSGLLIVVVDVRGRGNSEGKFRPFIQEAEDGYDVVEWAARLPRCNGKVAMWGGSYLGYVQWAIAKKFPPHLATIVPTAAPCMGVDFSLHGNISTPLLLHWATLTAGRVTQRSMYSDSNFWSTAFCEWHKSGKSLRDADTFVGSSNVTYQQWLSHPEPDAYWDAYNPTSDAYRRIEIPVLTITGIYDANQSGALEHYRRLMLGKSDRARERHYLIIGPWDHYGTGVPNTKFGGLKLGPACLLDIPSLHLEWYAWTMLNGAKPKFLDNNVAYYVTGAEKWRYAGSLEGITSKMLVLYLDSTVNPTEIRKSGALRHEPSAVGMQASFVYDPKDVSLADLERSTDPSSLVDQRLIIAASGKQLVYHSDVYAVDTEVSGFFKVELWISIDQKDTDFKVSIYEIDDAGGSVLLSTDMLRARYRGGLREPKLIETEEPLLYEFGRFSFISRCVRKGSRLRLVIGSVNSIYFEKNYNAGGVVAEECAENAKAVRVTVYQDSDHRSMLYVPLGQTESSIS